MNEQEMKDWIDGANYRQLLCKIRFEPANSKWFDGKIGNYFYIRFSRVKSQTSTEDRVSASKSMGW